MTVQEAQQGLGESGGVELRVPAHLFPQGLTPLTPAGEGQGETPRRLAGAGKPLGQGAGLAPEPLEAELAGPPQGCEAGAVPYPGEAGGGLAGCPR